MHSFLLLRIPSASADEVAAQLAERPGVLGIEELPATGEALFPVDAEHQFVRFDDRARYDEWLRAENFRRDDFVLLKVYVTAEFPECEPFKIVGRGVVEPHDYLATMREQHHGRVIDKFWVGPPWETPPPGQLPVVIECGMAFGLGDHPTTQMCLGLLAGIPAARRVLDFGAGSGILAIAAAKLFPGCELDLVEINRQHWRDIEHNFALNRLPSPTIHEEAPPGRFDVVLANVYLEVLRSVVTLNAPRIIISGLFGAEQLADLHLGPWRIARQLSREDWFALDLERC